MRWEQPGFPCPEGQGDAMGTGGSGQRRLDGHIVRRTPPRGGSESGRAGGDPGRSGSGNDRGGAETGGRDLLRAQCSAGQGACRCSSRHRDEWRAADSVAWFSPAGDCAGLVRDGGGEMAATHRRDGAALQRLLPDGRLRFLAARRGRGAACADHANAGEISHRPAGNQRSRRRWDRLSRRRRRLDIGRRNRESRTERGWRSFVAGSVIGQKAGPE